MDRQYNIGVIGATGVTGQKIVRALCLRGYTVLIGGRDHKALQRMCSALGDHCVAQTVDVTSHESLVDFLQRIPVLIQCVGPFMRWAVGAGSVPGGSVPGIHRYSSGMHLAWQWLCILGMGRDNARTIPEE